MPFYVKNSQRGLRKFFTSLRLLSRRISLSHLSLPPLHLLFASSEFSTRIKRTRKMFAHAPDRPVCHDRDSLHPSTLASLRACSFSLSLFPSLPPPSLFLPLFLPHPVPPFASLFVRISLRRSPPLPPRSLRSFSLSLIHARAQVSPFFLLSLLSRRHTPARSPLFDAGIPAKTICQDAGRNCKAGSTLFNLERFDAGPRHARARATTTRITALTNRKLTTSFVALTMFR